MVSACDSTARFRTLLDRAKPQLSNDRLIRLVAGIRAAAPDRTLQQIAAQLEAMRERTPRGGTRWHSSSVKICSVRPSASVWPQPDLPRVRSEAGASPG